MSPDEVGPAIDRVRSMTDQPFGVNFHMFQPGADRIVDTIIAKKVTAVSFGRGPDKKMIARFREAGIRCVPTVGAVKHAKKMVELGVDMVVHSATKFLGGHGNSMGGVIVDSGKFDWGQNDKFPHLSKPSPAYHGLTFWETFGDMAFAVACRVISLRDLGPAISPFNAWIILTGMETLSLRMRKHCDNALAVAKWLSTHPQVSWVNYAGLEGHKHHELAKKYCPNGAGSVFTLGLKGGYDAGVRAVSSTSLLSHLANIGDTRSLIIHPASTTHSQLSAEQLKQAGAGPDVVRLSIGIEDVEDIIADIDQAIS